MFDYEESAFFICDIWVIHVGLDYFVQAVHRLENW